MIVNLLGVRSAHAGGPTDTLPPLPMLRLPDAPAPAALSPFMPRTLNTFDVHGGTWFAPSNGDRLYYRTPAGDTVRVIEWPRPARAFAGWEEDSIATILAGWPVPVYRAALGIGPQRLRALHADEEGRLYVEVAPDRLADTAHRSRRSTPTARAGRRVRG